MLFDLHAFWVFMLSLNSFRKSRLVSAEFLSFLKMFCSSRIPLLLSVQLDFRWVNIWCKSNIVDFLELFFSFHVVDLDSFMKSETGMVRVVCYISFFISNSEYWWQLILDGSLIDYAIQSSYWYFDLCWCAWTYHYQAIPQHSRSKT